MFFSECDFVSTKINEKFSNSSNNSNNTPAVADPLDVGAEGQQPTRS